MLRSKLQPSAIFLYLDTDTLFLILISLPTLIDAVHTVSVNRQMRAFFRKRSFWQHQLRRDLYIEAPVTTKDFGLFYQERLNQIAAERKLVLSFLSAYQYTAAIGGITKQEKHDRIARLKLSLATDTAKVFYAKVNNPVYGRSSTVTLNRPEENKIWGQLMRDKSHGALITPVKLLPLYLLPDKLSKDFSHSISFFLATLAIANAHTTLYQLIHQISAQQKMLVLERLGPDMLCLATAMGHLETVRLLLESGVNPNHYGLYLDAGENHNLRKMLALPMFFLHGLQKQKECVIKKNTVITAMLKLFLQHGANVDLPATQEVGATVEENQARQSLREVTRLFLEETEANKNQYKKLEFTELQKSVKTISQAPELRQNDENVLAYRAR